MYIYIFFNLFTFFLYLGYGLKFVLAALMTPGLYFLKSFLFDKYGLLPLPVEGEEEIKTETFSK
jgi:hypothetical protein